MPSDHSTGPRLKKGPVEMLNVLPLCLFSLALLATPFQVPAVSHAGGGIVVRPRLLLGEVLLLPDACPQGSGSIPGTVCLRLEVRCEGLQPVRVSLRVAPPATGVPVRGTVIFSSGGGGTGFYGSTSGGISLFQSLAAMGFQVVDRAWDGPNGWTTAEAGLRSESRRYAALLTWVFENVHAQGAFVASGNSGGSAEVGYALTTWQRDEILDLAVPTSGPAVARLDYACGQPTPLEWLAMCPAIVPPGALQCTPSCTLSPGNGVCNQLPGTPTIADLREDSVMHTTARVHHPATRVHFLYGALDCGQSVPMGLTWSLNVTSDKVIEFVPNTPHGMSSTVEGREAIRHAIDIGVP